MLCVPLSARRQGAVAWLAPVPAALSIVCVSFPYSVGLYSAFLLGGVPVPLTRPFLPRSWEMISVKSLNSASKSRSIGKRRKESRTGCPAFLSKFIVIASTHSTFGEKSHTRAHTAKHGAFPRPQRSFVLSVKFLLFCHTFIYIHFPVLCEPSTPAEEKNPAKLPP